MVGVRAALEPTANPNCKPLRAHSTSTGRPYLLLNLTFLAFGSTTPIPSVHSILALRTMDSRLPSWPRTEDRRLQAEGPPTERETTMKRRILIGALTALALVSGASREAVAQSAASKAAPPAAIPRVSLNNVARQGYFYAGGQYVGRIGPMKEPTMGGAMYFEVMVPKQSSRRTRRVPPWCGADGRRLAADA